MSHELCIRMSHELHIGILGRNASAYFEFSEDGAWQVCVWGGGFNERERERKRVN